MAKIWNAYLNALLADAAYIDFWGGQTAEEIADYDKLIRRVTAPQASLIAKNFEIASVINTADAIGAGSGFDATVWRGRTATEFDGKIFVSMRGTEPDAGGQDLMADADLALSTAARSQIIDMVNWWLRETTPVGLQVRQIGEVVERLWIDDPNAIEPRLVVKSKIVVADFVAATGRLFGVSAVQVNGHSLGGHMASAFARVFGGRNLVGMGVQIEGVKTFNSAGFNGANSESFFAQIQNLLGMGLPSFVEVSDRQINFFAENGIEVTTNTWWFTQFGQRVGQWH